MALWPVSTIICIKVIQITLEDGVFKAEVSTQESEANSSKEAELLFIVHIIWLINYYTAVKFILHL